METLRREWTPHWCGRCCEEKGGTPWVVCYFYFFLFYFYDVDKTKRNMQEEEEEDQERNTKSKACDSLPFLCF
jgi:hypothetical protein